jgi:aryl-alcohol dehydrogenase-like predicted oxidoreductase
VNRRVLGKLGWDVGEVGFGMWGIGGWTGSDDLQSLATLKIALDLGCNFFDTAWEYGEGRSERVLGQLLRDDCNERLYIATKIPPKTMIWPSHRGDPIEESFPADHIREYVEKSLENLGRDTIDLIQFHVWEDDWADDDRWQRTIDDLKGEGVIRGVGISLNRWEPWNSLRTLGTGQIDAVQVVYNVFDQAPEDELLPMCQEMDVAVIARVPFDEGSLTGVLTTESSWPEDDWRTTYFTPKNLAASVERVEELREIVPSDMSLPELALRFVLAHPGISVVIPGMRTAAHVRENLAVSDGKALSPGVLDELRKFRWDRGGPEWSAEALA